MKKSKTIAIIGCILLAIATVFLPSASIHAESVCDHLSPDSEVYRANGCGGSSTAVDLENAVIGIVNGIVGVLSLVAVIFIVVGGIHFMTAAGDASKVEKAKKTILYATIGLIICVLAFAIVNFVIANIINS